MTPVMQSKLYTPEAITNGNCLTACLASLLDVPLWMVPPFEDMFSKPEWRQRLFDWVARMFNQQITYVNEHQVEQLPEYYIACGPSPRGVGHAVIFRRGELAHDPHPSGAGIVEVERVWYLAPHEEAS